MTIRDVPDAARDELASSAASSGRSLQEYLRSELLNLVQRPDPAVRIRERKRLTKSTLSADQILKHQDEDRP